MAQLENLLYSLTTVIVLYHDSQSGVKKLTSENAHYPLRMQARACAKNILTHKEISFSKHLNELIDECTKEYPGRKHFLTYLLNEIMFLKSLQERTKPFSSSELEEYIKILTQLFVDFKQLLCTTKSKTYEVNCNQMKNTPEFSSSLSGLATNQGYFGNTFGNTFCNSGLLLKEEVLDRFNISTLDSEKIIQLIAIDIGIEHQNALLVAELRSQNELLTQANSTQQNTIDLLTHQIKTVNSELLLIDENKSKNKPDEINLSIEGYKSESLKLNSELTEAKNTIEKQQNAIFILKQKISGDSPKIGSLPSLNKYYHRIFFQILPLQPSPKNEITHDSSELLQDLSKGYKE